MSNRYDRKEFKKNKSRSRSPSSDSHKKDKHRYYKHHKDRPRDKDRYRRDYKDKEPKQEKLEINTFVLIAKNISRNVTKKHLTEIFSPYGELISVLMPKANEGNTHKGYAYIEYNKNDDAEKAMLYMDGGQIDGLEIKISELNFKKPKRSRSRSKDDYVKKDKSKRKDSSSSSSSESSSEESSSSRSSS